MLYKNILKPPVLIATVTSLWLSSTAHADTPMAANKPTEVVISASRVEMARESSGSAITILDSDYLEQNQVQMVSDVLRDVPGVAVSQAGGAGATTQVRIRGAEANQTLVLIDGIEVNDVAGGSEFSFAHLLNLEVERIEVLRGAQSALWGSDAMGGVINIVTKRGQGSLNGKVTIEGGSYDTHQEALTINAGTDDYHYALSGTLFNTNGISVASEERGSSEKDGYKNATINLKSGINLLDNLSMDLVVRHLNADADTDSFIGGIGAIDSDDSSETTQTSGRLSAKLNLLDEQWNHQLSFSANDTENTFFTAGTQNYNSQGYKQKYEYQTDLFLYSSLANSDDLEHRFTFATEYEEEEFYSKGFSTIDHDMDMSGYIFEYGANIDDRYYVTVAGRRDINSLFQNANSYRLTFAGWVTDSIRLHTSKGTGIKNPTLFELFGSTPDYTGNADLRPEKNSTWDLGTEYHFSPLDGYVDLTYFHTDVNNLITGSGQTSINMPTDAKIQGVELSLVLRPGNNIRLNSSYTYTDSNDGSGNELIRRPKHIASINGSYLFPDDQTRLTTGVQYNGKQDDIEYDSNWSQSTVTLSDYTLVNVALTHQLNKQIELFGRVENLLNEEYEEVLTYGTKGINGTVGITIKGSL